MSLGFRIFAAYLVVGGAGVAGIYAVVNSSGGNGGVEEIRGEVVKPELTIKEKEVKPEEQESVLPPKKEEIIEEAIESTISVTKEERAPQVQEVQDLEITESSEPQGMEEFEIEEGLAAQPESENTQGSSCPYWTRTMCGLRAFRQQARERISKFVGSVRSVRTQLTNSLLPQ